MVGGFFTGWATSSSQWVVDVIGESEGQNFWCYALEEEWKMGNCMKFRLSLRKEFGNCLNNIRQEGRVFKFMYWGMWMMDSLEVLCFNFFFQWRKKKIISWVRTGKRMLRSKEWEDVKYLSRRIQVWVDWRHI